MPVPEALTDADRQLKDQLAVRGYEVTARQFKRWREAGLLPPPVQQSRGRGAGRRSLTYPEGVVRRAEAILNLLRLKIPLRYVTVILFARGFQVPEERLKAAYAQILDDVEPHAFDEHDPSDGADRLAQKLRKRAKRVPLARQWIRRADTYGARKGSVLEDALVALSTILFADEQPDEQAGAAIGQIVGAPVDGAADLIDRLELTTIPALRATLGELAPGGLVRARDLLTRSLSVADQLQQLNLSMHGKPIAEGLADWHLVDELSQALGILSMAAVLRGVPGYEQALEKLETLLIATIARADGEAPLHSETRHE